MSLSDRIKRVYRKRVLKLGNGIAESGKFARGHAPNIRKRLDTSVTLVAQKTDNEKTRDKKTVILIFMMRDESLETGGVDQLCEGDLYWRDPEFDSDQRPFVWTGEKRNEGQHYTVGIFERYESASQGQGV